MKKIYTICVETNDGGFYNADNTFTDKLDAICFLRKAIARKIIFRRAEGDKIIYLNVYAMNLNSYFPQVIEIGIQYGKEIYRYDYRVKEINLIESEEDFKKTIIQL